MFVKLAVKFPLLFQSGYFSILKLAHDALKELVRTNSCKYSFMVATHLKCTFVGQTRSRVPMDCMLSTST